jgi:hypothetical protein
MDGHSLVSLAVLTIGIFAGLFSSNTPRLARQELSLQTLPGDFLVALVTV